MKAKTIKIWYWIITILFVAFMLMSGLQELFRTQQAVAINEQLGYPLYLLTILGIAKILGCLALLQTKWKTLKEWAYAGFTIDILGAAMSNGFVDGIAMFFATIPFLIPMILSYWLWKKLN